MKSQRDLIRLNNYRQDSLCRVKSILLCMVIFIAVPAIMYGQNEKSEKYIKALEEQGISRSQIISFDKNGIPRISARSIDPQESFAKSKTSAEENDDLPSELRAWEAIPGVVRNDGKETFRLEVELNQEVNEVRLKSPVTTTGDKPNFIGAGNYPITLKDDGKGEDRIADDQVYTAGPFQYNTEEEMNKYYGDEYEPGEEASSPEGLDFLELGKIIIETPEGETEEFAVQPKVGVLRKDIPAIEVQKIAEDVQIASHFINMKTDRRNLQISMHASYEVRDSGGYGTRVIRDRLYELLPDVFHFLNYISTNRVETRPRTNSYNLIAGQHSTLRTDYIGTGEGGTGDELYSNTILGINKLDVADRGLNANTATHEFMHQWAAYLNKDLGISKGSHYVKSASTASLLNGYDYIEHSDSTFTLDCEDTHGVEKPPPLDLYLMGLIPGGEVPPIYVPKDTVHISDYCEPYEWQEERMDDPPVPDTLTPAHIERVVTIDDIQEVHGVRRPGPRNAQKNFRIGYVGTSHDRLLNETEMTFFNILAKHRGSEEEQPNYFQKKNTWSPLQGYFGYGTNWNTEIPQHLDQKEPKPVTDLKLETKNDKIELSWKGWDANSTEKYIINKGKSTSQMQPVDTVNADTKTYESSLGETVFYSIQPINKYDNKSQRNPVVSYFDKTVNLPTQSFRMISSTLEKEKPIDDNVKLYRFNDYYRYGGLFQEPSDGYWIMGNPKDTLNFVGQGVERDVVYVYEGWNLIGGLADTVKIASIIDPEQVLDKAPVYTYDAEEQKYKEASVMAPFSAYWVYGGPDDKDGDIESETIIRDITRKSEEEAYVYKQKPEEYDHIVFSSKGVEKKLYYSEEKLTEDTRYNYLLPPEAPGTTLDVRTEDGFRIADSHSVALNISADQYPVYVSVEKNQMTSFGYKLVAVEEGKPNVEIPLYEGRTEELAKGYDHVYLKKTETPEEPDSYKVSSNYPNPFNPTTTIKYQVPEQTDVLVEVYNILGQTTKTLVDEQKLPGEYTIQFDGSQLASGIYFLRIKAGTFVDTQKMTLIK